MDHPVHVHSVKIDIEFCKLWELRHPFLECGLYLTKFCEKIYCQPIHVFLAEAQSNQNATKELQWLNLQTLYYRLSLPVGVRGSPHSIYLGYAYACSLILKTYPYLSKGQNFQPPFSRAFPLSKPP